MSDKPNSANTFTIDARTIAEIDKLKAGLGASSTVEVIQKALGLAKLAVRHADTDANLTIGQAGSAIDVNLKR